jgi:hypothetical protein
MRIRKSTMVELVTELEKLPEPRGQLVELMITEAKAGEYHDYKNQKYVCGKVAVVGLLREAGLDGLAKQVMNGDYDEEADEQDKAEMRKMLAENGMSAPGFKKIFGL